MERVQPMMPETCWALARPNPNLPPPTEGEIRLVRLNGGRLATRGLAQPDRADQCVALWIPDGVPTVRGAIVELHRASVAARTDYHAVARTLGFAVFGALVRWANFTKVLPDQLGKLAAALGHPEVANVPWALVVGSRNVAAAASFVRQDPNPHRLLCLLTNGGPDVAVDLSDARAVARFRGVPVMTVNGTEDPYVEGLDWFRAPYPRIRAARLPWCAAPDWGGGHAGRTNGALYWPFVVAALAARYPRDADPRRGRVRLRPLRERQGLLLGPVDWDDPPGDGAGSLAPPPRAGVRRETVWFPSAAVAAVWRAYAARAPLGRLAARADTGRGATIRLQFVGRPSRGATEARFYDGDRLLGVRRRPPFAIRTRALARGVHAVFVEWRMGDRRVGFTRPVVLADGRIVNQAAGIRAAGGRGERLTHGVAANGAPAAS
jgi:hypothetical protein